MKRSNLMATLVTLGFATAVATPALALENQFSGAFTSFYDLSNYSAAGNFGATSNAEGLKDGAPTENYFVQRVRLGYTAKASEDVKLVTRFELDYGWYGNSSYTVGRNSGGGLGADSVNIETKNLYLDLNLPKSVNAKIGMMGYNDSFKGILFDADMAGILLSHEYEKASVKAGFFRFADNTDANTWAGIDKIGRYTNDMFALDAKYRVNDRLKVGAAYYYIDDNRSNGSTTTASAVPIGQTADGTPIYSPTTTFTTTANPANDVKVHTVGLNAETSVGPVTLTGFALAQFGDLSSTQKAKGYAFNIGAKMPLAGGTVRSEFLYTGGGKNSLYVPASPIGAEGGGFYDAEMIMLNRDKNATTIDNAIVYDSNNFDQGVIMGSVGYDYTFTPKLSGSANAGFAAVAKDVSKTHNSDYLGTEINCEANYQLMPAVTVGGRAGYVFLGDYFKNIDAGNTPDNPYDIKLIAKYAF
ncbi:MAG: porin [Desulfuromonadaceae bacterium]|nr:porin [Desulfuromonadaceae bacterium]